MMDTMFVADLTGPLVLAVLVALVIWDRRRARRSKTPMVEDGPEGEPYRVFTRAHDLEIPAEQVATALPEASRDARMGWTDSGGKWVANRAQLRRFDAEQASPSALAQILSIPDATNTVICLLIDQSGSMQGAPIGATASAVRALADTFAELGIANEILGFSTAGWHGGFARQDWTSQGNPARPGRLCALLHIVYKDAGQRAWSEASRDAFLNPDILRENVDGEAIEWAASRLAALPQTRKLLVVLSDGAPVDDSTLTDNGPSYLWRHLNKAIARINASGTVTLGAVGIGHRVDSFYPTSREASLGSIANATVEIINALATGR